MRLVPEGFEESPAGALESPSLFADGADGPAAYELKFLLSEEQARGVEARVRGPLSLDRHADPARGNAYLTTSLYTDTPGFDILRRSPTAGGSKYRVRRYGTDGPAFVEQKAKTGDRVRKRRAEIARGQLALLADGTVSPDWPGSWFRDGVTALGLRPVCRIAYDRVAYLGVADGGTVRVTFDRNVRGESADGWAVGPVGDAPVLLAGSVVGEFKFRVALPPLLKGVMAEFGLFPAQVSKYRLFMGTTGEPADA